jgi:hypothetical protein
MKADLEVGANTKGIKAHRDYIPIIEKYLIKILGNRLITNIDYAALQELEAKRIEMMGKIPSRSTILTHNAALNKVFREAEVRGYLTDVSKPILEVKCWRAFKIDHLCALNFDQAFIRCRLLHRCG